MYFDGHLYDRRNLFYPHKAWCHNGCFPTIWKGRLKTVYLLRGWAEKTFLLLDFRHTMLILAITENDIVDSLSSLPSTTTKNGIFGCWKKCYLNPRTYDILVIHNSFIIADVYNTTIMTLKFHEL